MIADPQTQEIISSAADEHTKVDRLNARAWELRNMNPDGAKEILKEALRIAEAENYTKGKADGLHHLGFSLMQTGQHESAYRHVFQALEMYVALDDAAGIANSHYALGIIHIRTANFDASIEALHKCLAYRESQNDKDGMAACLFQLSYISRHFNDEEGWKGNILRALELRRQTGDQPGIAAAMMVLGEFYTQKKELAKAREALEESLRIRKEIGETLGYFASMLPYTEIYMEEGALEQAKEFALEGIRLAAEKNVTYGVIRFMRMLGIIESRMNDPESAKRHCLEALEMAEKFSFKSIVYEIHETLAELYKQEGDYKSALLHFENFTRTRQEVISFQSNLRIQSVKLMSQIDSAKREAELERTKNEQLQEAYSIIEEKNKDITDSIRYAKRIQNGFLPSENELNGLLGEYFVFYRPRDIVSGDFYWASPVTTTPGQSAGEKLVVLAAVDCTGHGVPGAFMSILGNMLINQTVRNPEINSPAAVLDFLNQELPKSLKAPTRDEVIRDGMDMVMIALDFAKMKMHYAAANNPIYAVRNAQLIELKGDKQPISGSDDMPKKPFTDHTFALEKGDCVYLFTDGFADQFGGPRGKKFKYRQLQEKLIGAHGLPMKEQREMLEKIFDDWKGDLEQVDDVLLIGVRV